MIELGSKGHVQTSKCKSCCENSAYTIIVVVSHAGKDATETMEWFSSARRGFASAKRWTVAPWTSQTINV